MDPQPLPAHDDGDRQDRIWLSLVAQGGRPAEKAAEALFRKYRTRLLRFLLARRVRAEDAEDLVQETFVRMVRKAATFRGDKGTPVSAWLFRIAANAHVDETRGNSPETTLDDEAWLIAESDKDRLRDRQQQEAAQCAAEGLQACYDEAYGRFAEQFPERAEALALLVHQKWDIDAIAGFLRRSNAATREYLSQCRKKLRVFVEPCRVFLREV